MWTQKGAGGRQEPAAWAHNLSSSVNQAVTEGFTECFKITSRGLYAISSGRYFRPEQIRVVDTCLFESQSTLEPTALYVLETFDGIKGTLAETGSQVAAFIAEAEAYQAKVSRFNRHHC